MFDTILRGGQIVGVDGLTTVDVAIKDGRIAALLKPGHPAEAGAVLDCAGRLLFPGLVDAHVHLREPGLTQKEDFVSGTRAAAAGGVTTLLVMPTDQPWTETPEQLAGKIAASRGRLHVDAAFQVAISKRTVDLKALRDTGAISFEIFTADVPDEFRHDSLHELLAALRRCHGLGPLTCISPGDQSLLAATERSGGSDFVAFANSRPPLAEASGIARAILAAADTGARVHIRQSNAGLGMAVLRRLKDMADVSIETTPQNLLFTQQDYAKGGAAIKASPPFRQATDVAGLRRAVRDGLIDIVCTDHAPHTPAEKAASYPRFTGIPGGMPGVQTLLPLMLHLASAGAFDLPDIVRLCSANPARRFGLAGRKGLIEAGGDADIVVVDPTRSSTIENADQHSKACTTPFAGFRLPYRLERTLLRGRTVAIGQSVEAEPTGEVVIAASA